MTSEQIIQLLVLVLGTGGIGGLIVGGLRDDWASRRQLQHQKQEERLARERAEVAAREAAENFLNEQGRRRFEDLEQRANKAEEDRIAAQKQIDTLIENQLQGKREREVMQKQYDDLNARYTESERLLTVQAGEAEKIVTRLRSDLAHVIEELAAEKNARLATEEREKAARNENDTLKLEKTRLEHRIDELQQEINVLKAEVATLKTNGNGKGDTGPLPPQP